MKTHLYVLSEPGGSVRYAGRTVNPLPVRLEQHLGDAKRGVKDYRCNWLRSLSGPPEITLLCTVEGNGNDEERALIAGLRDAGYQLVNTTDGGDGKLGWVPSAATRRKMSAAQLQRAPASADTREKIAKAKRGVRRKPFSAEWRQKMSAAHKGVGHTAATRKKLSAVNTGKTLSAETKARISAARLGQKMSDTTKAKIAVSLTGRVRGPPSAETRAKLSAAAHRRQDKTKPPRSEEHGG